MQTTAQRPKPSEFDRRASVKLKVLAVGPKMDAWVSDGVNEYARRLPKAYALTVDAVAVSRKANADLRQSEEGERLLRKVSSRDHVVLLDEAGSQRSSEQLATRFRHWQELGVDVLFLLGGPDGHGDAVRGRSAETWSLSPATLPHGLARIVVVEQLYRAWTVVTGHPYHRA